MGQLAIQPDVEEEFVRNAEVLSSINEIESILKEITDISIATEHNKQICNVLKQRVCDANSMMLNLKVQKQQREEEEGAGVGAGAGVELGAVGAGVEVEVGIEDNDDQKEIFKIFNKKNYFYLQNLILVIKRIKNFVLEISQTNTLSNFIRSKSIEKTFKKLCDDFDDCMFDLSIITTPTTVANEEQFDEEELSKCLEKIEEVGDGVRDLRNEFATMVLLLDEMKMANIKAQQLKFSDFNETDKEPRKGGRVTKWVDGKNKCGEFAFKDISEDKNSVQNQVMILRELHNCENIIKFYGITCDGNKWYSVIEWAEYGNLREFYTNYKHLFDIKLKLRMSLDIARGLNFLRSLEIVHRDIRAENVLITRNDTAKLTNFKLCCKSRAATFTSFSFRQYRNLARDRYCAPELLERGIYLKYDYNCEVYSFGILLWEIAEERIPYKDYEGLIRISILVRNKHREPFSENSAMPEEFKSLSISAVDHDPESRPMVTTMFEVLGNCFESFERLSLIRTPSNPASNSSQNNQNCTLPEPTPKKHSRIRKLLSYNIFK